MNSPLELEIHKRADAEFYYLPKATVNEQIKRNILNRKQ